MSESLDKPSGRNVKPVESGKQESIVIRRNRRMSCNGLVVKEEPAEAQKHQSNQLARQVNSAFSYCSVTFCRRSVKDLERPLPVSPVLSAVSQQLSRMLSIFARRCLGTAGRGLIPRACQYSTQIGENRADVRKKSHRRATIVGVIIQEFFSSHSHTERVGAWALRAGN